MLLSTKDKIKNVAWILFQLLLLALMFFIGYTFKETPLRALEPDELSWGAGLVILAILGVSYWVSEGRNKGLASLEKELMSSRGVFTQRPHPILLLGDKNSVFFLNEYLKQFEIFSLYLATRTVC